MATYEYASLFQSIIKELKEYKGSAVNIVIVFGTVTLKSIVENEIFYCPCVAPESLKNCDKTSDYKDNSLTCMQWVNRMYGIALIIFPAITLLFLSVLAMPKLWKVITGCLNKSKRHRKQNGGIISVVLSVCYKSFIAPFTWLVVMLLDGRYLACSLTSLPYNVGPNKTYETCNMVSQSDSVKMSDSFNTNVIISQSLGWFIFAILVCVGFVTQIYVASTSRLTYYHAKYFRIYRNYEEHEIDKAMKNRAGNLAVKNAELFMSAQRSKEEWDELSQECDVQKNKQNLCVSSCLHKWVIHHKYQDLGLTMDIDDIDEESEYDTNIHSLAWESMMGNKTIKKYGEYSKLQNEKE